MKGVPSHSRSSALTIADNATDAWHTADFCTGEELRNLECGDTSPLFVGRHVARRKARTCPRTPYWLKPLIISLFSHNKGRAKNRRVLGTALRANTSKLQGSLKRTDYRVGGKTSSRFLPSSSPPSSKIRSAPQPAPLARESPRPSGHARFPLLTDYRPPTADLRPPTTTIPGDVGGNRGQHLAHR